MISARLGLNYILDGKFVLDHVEKSACGVLSREVMWSQLILGPYP